MFEDKIEKLKFYIKENPSYEYEMGLELERLEECQAEVEEKKKLFLADCYYYDEPFFKRIFGEVKDAN